MAQDLSAHPLSPDPVLAIFDALDKRQWGVALALGQSAVSSDDKNPDLWNALGSAYHMLRIYGEAVRCFTRATELAPDGAEAWTNLAAAHAQLGHGLDAFDAACVAVNLAPASANALRVFGVALYKIGEVRSAVEAYEAALKIAPDDPETLDKLGSACKSLGDFEAAELCFAKALRAAPQLGQTHVHLSAVHRYAPGDPHLASLLQLYQTADDGSVLRSQLCFALANALEQLDDTSGAYALLVEGNAIRKRLSHYDIAQDISLFDRLSVGLNGLSAAPSCVLAGQGPRPVFVLGMPRSGTSLVHQILSRHAQVHGGGELPFAAQFGQDLAMGMVAPTAEALEAFRAAYLERAARLAGDAPVIVDKMPHNFMLIGVIARAFPEAVIVQMQRDPAAVLWSNFRQPFSGAGLGYTCDLNDLRQYHDHYAAFMARCAAAFPGRIQRCDYEALVENPGAEIRALLAQVQLPWDAACLRPEDNDAAVCTASSTQLRQPIYTGSSQAWKRYQPHIGDVFDGISDAGPAALARFA